MALIPLDEERLTQALLAAQAAVGVSDPNPRVGCVLGRESGQVLGVGSTQQAGGPHAEVMALRQARAAGHDLHGATAWVTLEPCSHHGRTPPCCEALAEAGITRVLVAVQDPFPAVAGRGIARLRAAGMTVELASGPVAEAARDLNVGFFSRFERGRPWVRLKVAASMDGRTALDNGASQWITGPAARADGHAWRKRAGAVLSGIGTVLADDPRLDVRLVEWVLQPLRVVVDSTLRLSPCARVLQPPGRCLVVTAASLAEPRAQALANAGAEVIALPGANGRVDLPSMLSMLAQRDINEVHVEGGAELNAALIAQGLVDELLLYLAPVLVGPGRAIAHWDSLSSLTAAPRFKWVENTMVGNDLRLRARLLTVANSESPVGGLDSKVST